MKKGSRIGCLFYGPLSAKAVFFTHVRNAHTFVGFMVAMPLDL